MTNPFDDPEVKAAMAQAGIVHKPGMAEELLSQLAPLLAADGIDLDNLAEDVDLDTLNAALGSAVDKRNAALVTPFGLRREQAVEVLRDFAVALALGDEHEASLVLNEVQPDESAELPAISHVIGTGLMLLDEWHTDARLKKALAKARVPRWDRPSQAAGREILALARRGRAFAKVDDLIGRHAGLAVYEGAALVVAGSVAALAAHRKVSAAEAAAELFPSENAGRPGLRLVSDAPESAFVKPTPKGGLAGLMRGFREYLERVGEYSGPSVEDEARVFEAVVAIGGERGFDLRRADDVLSLFREFDDGVEFDWDEETAFALLSTLHDYTHYQAATAGDSRPWDALCDEMIEVLEERSSEESALFGLLAGVVQKGDEVAPRNRRAAVSKLKIVSGVRELLGWIGRGRKVTQTGGVRRADIEPVAGMLGVRAVGVAKLPPWEDYVTARDKEGLTYALSMAEVPLLPSWWDALVAAGVIQVNTSSVKPGPEADAWLAKGGPDEEKRDFLVGTFVAYLLTGNLDRPGAYFEAQMFAVAVTELVGLLAPDEVPDTLPTSPFAFAGPRAMRDLAVSGLVVKNKDGSKEIPVALRSVVARGVMMAIALSAPNEGDTDDL